MSAVMREQLADSATPKLGARQLIAGLAIGVFASMAVSAHSQKNAVEHLVASTPGISAEFVDGKQVLIVHGRALSRNDLQRVIAASYVLDKGQGIKPDRIETYGLLN